MRKRKVIFQYPVQNINSISKPKPPQMEVWMQQHICGLCARHKSTKDIPVRYCCIPTVAQKPPGGLVFPRSYRLVIILQPDDAVYSGFPLINSNVIEDNVVLVCCLSQPEGWHEVICNRQDPYTYCTVYTIAKLC